MDVVCRGALGVALRVHTVLRADVADRHCRGAAGLLALSATPAASHLLQHPSSVPHCTLQRLRPSSACRHPRSFTVCTSCSMAAVSGATAVSPVSSVCIQSALCLCCALSVFDGSSRPVSGKNTHKEEGVVTSCLCLVFDSSTQRWNHR